MRPTLRSQIQAVKLARIEAAEAKAKALPARDDSQVRIFNNGTLHMIAQATGRSTSELLREVSEPIIERVDLHEIDIYANKADIEKLTDLVSLLTARIYELEHELKANSR